MHCSCIDMLLLLINIPLLISGCASAFSTQQKVARRCLTYIQLVPICKLFPEAGVLLQDEKMNSCFDSRGCFRGDDGNTYELGIAEENDLPVLARFYLDNFGQEAIRLSQDLSSFERMLVQPAVETINGYSWLVSFGEALAGLRGRLSLRISSEEGMNLLPPPIDGEERLDPINIASRSALAFVLAKTGQSSDVVQVIACVELSLQPCDAKIPFTLPWLDRWERRLASVVGGAPNEGGRFEPYLSNLCVDKYFRGKRIGRAMVRCVENVASSVWGYSTLYLHVDETNLVAVQLYKAEGYSSVSTRWRPFWAGKATSIGYYKKQIK